MAAASATHSPPEKRRLRGRVVLIGVGLVALGMVLSPAIVYRLVQPTLCPTTITAEGRVQGGVNWEFTRSQCDGGRIVHQVRVAPMQGVMRLAVDLEGGPGPTAIAQVGRVLTVTLAGPLADGATTVTAEIDHRARPRDVTKVREGRVVSP